MFLPATREEIEKRGWGGLDVILVTGDTYIDSPYIGAALIGNILVGAGYRVGVIAQPDVNDSRDIMRLGEPDLFWGITAGSVDSMVANYTALKKRRQSDDFTPGGKNTRRPDRATIVYSNLIRRCFKNTRPLVLGGIEASLRRIAHYDYWDDAVRRSLLFDAKADILVYGMGEKATLEIAGKLKRGEDIRDIRGICYSAKEPKGDYLLLPSYEEVKNDKAKFTGMFHLFYENNDPLTARGLCQRQDTRYLVQNPPAAGLSEKELDEVHTMSFEREVHPYYKRQGTVRALDTIAFSLTTHRGCYGECNFCAIAVHQGRTIRSRSIASILQEAEVLTRHPGFKGYIADVGGPTANMYGIECDKKLEKGSCRKKRCLYPGKCGHLKVNHARQRELLRVLRNSAGVKRVFIASGIRYDMILEDPHCGMAYLRDVVEHHISGQLKIAPEHVEDSVLKRMGKPGKNYLQAFKEAFDVLNKQKGKKQFLTYYLIAAHPGCDVRGMEKLRAFASRELKISPEQVQIFTPLPSTYSTLMYYTGRDPFSGERLFVEKDMRKKEHQKAVVVSGGVRR
ncbi:MAG: YgiQ family radical SAM protein [Alphaproteobacteria bacterium]|uniref:YgiQ family radical SAM protein n=1 Tax=Candidatus Nitrobium versatile TaxID=2884831 RepID=A0A953M330_9BACT|nr:YgiQ family radical SAM protein [Candidatus Nitrobium versatile]